MKLSWLIGILCCIAYYGKSQKNVFITLSPKVAGSDLSMSTDIVDLSGVVFNLAHFDYYLSGLHLIHDGGIDLDLSDSVYLIEPQNHVLYLGYLNVNTIEQINFGIGVPASINTNGGPDAIDISAYPPGHPLSFQDPSMHWGWTAGYMHMIIGGLADSNMDGIADNNFELHNVGDGNYSNVFLPVIQTNTLSDQIDIYVDCNVDVWLKEIPIASVGILHGSSGYNMEVMKNVEMEQVFTQPATATNPELENKIGNVFFTSTIESMIIQWEYVNGAAHYELSDLSGKIIQTNGIDGINGKVSFQNLKSGIYNFRIFDKNSKELNSIKVAN